MTTEANKDRTKIDASPDSTWGATEEAKAAWERKYGTAIRKAAAKEAKEEKENEK